MACGDAQALAMRVICAALDLARAVVVWTALRAEKEL